MRMDTDERSKEKGGAFQSEEFEASLDDEELLLEMRKKRWEDNARWQIGVFARANLGAFSGTSTAYTPTTRADGSVRFAKEETKCSCLVEAPEDGSSTVVMADTMSTPALGVDMQVDFRAFTPEAGNMAVSNAYSLVQAEGDGALLVELALREGTRRVRAKLLYSAMSDTERRLEQLAVVRETVAGSGAFSDGELDDETDLDGSPGRGLYDPPSNAHDGSAYTTLYCDGGLTLKFPSCIPASVAGFISVDWIAGKMRYQLDRKFAALDGSLASLELTEISKQDSMDYPPERY